MIDLGRATLEWHHLMCDAFRLARILTCGRQKMCVVETQPNVANANLPPPTVLTGYYCVVHLKVDCYQCEPKLAGDNCVVCKRGRYLHESKCITKRECESLGDNYDAERTKTTSFGNICRKKSVCPEVALDRFGPVQREIRLKGTSYTWLIYCTAAQRV